MTHRLVVAVIAIVVIVSTLAADILSSWHCSVCMRGYAVFADSRCRRHRVKRIRA